MKDVFAAIAERSSTRSYTGEGLTKEELYCLLRAGLQAPTATNRQEIHISVLERSNPLLAEIEAEKNGGSCPPVNFYYDAPVVLILSGETAYHWTPVDAGIAVENIALAAEGLGLGSVIIGCIRQAMEGPRQAEFAQALRFPEGYSYQIAIAVGHKAAGKEPHAFELDRQVSLL